MEKKCLTFKENSEQEVLGRTDYLLSFGMSWTA
jgi:hypothetical protein